MEFILKSKMKDWVVCFDPSVCEIRTKLEGNLIIRAYFAPLYGSLWNLLWDLIRYQYKKNISKDTTDYG